MRDPSTIYRTRRHINSSKQHVTILFTDIEDSSKYWDKFGDVQGRLMVDRHNRLLFPMVHKFKGRIIKTIGDSIMAAFAKPEQAMKAAIAMQQTMASERQGDVTFDVRIRIGIHTGEAIVEKEDIYGDIVNVAARVESVGKGNALQRIKSGKVLLQKDYKEIGNLAWTKVLVGAEKYGWIVRVTPPQMGIPEKKVSQEYQFHFRYKDLYIFILGILFFIFGFWKFRIRPI